MLVDSKTKGLHSGSFYLVENEQSGQLSNKKNKINYLSANNPCEAHHLQVSQYNSAHKQVIYSVCPKIKITRQHSGDF